MTRLLRAVAVAIAIAALVDPVVTLVRASRARVAVVVQDPRRIDADRVRASLTADLAAAYDVVPALVSDAAGAIVIGTSYPESPVYETFGGPIFTVTLDTPNVRIAHVAAPRAVPAATAIHVEADVDARDAAGRQTDLVARIDGVEVGRAVHRWTRAVERWRASLDIVPFGDPPFVVRLDAGASRADVAVALRTAPIRVLVHDARPSWASTFTRRALEGDPRFRVDSTVQSSRGLAIRTGETTAPSALALDAFDAVIVGGLDAAASADMRALDRYMRVRGGAVIAIPDQRVAGGPAADLVPRAAERLLERPVTLAGRTTAALRASELMLLPGGSADDAEVLASTPGDEAAPVVVSTARGAGRLVVSGAMDAWRFRDADDRAFDRFWQATIAGAALATPPLVDVEVAPDIVPIGGRADVVVRVRSATDGAGVSAVFDGRPLRLWPAAEPGVYRGEIVAGTAVARSTIRAAAAGAVDGSASSHIVVVRDDAATGEAETVPLALLAASHGGIDVAPGRVRELERVIRARVTPPRAPRPIRPMRSAWWIAPFAGCLAGEWWLRRRRGLR